MARGGHTLTELILVVLIAAVLACVAVPRLQFGAVRRVTADAVAQKLVTDLRRARAAAILYAAENSQGFAVVMSGSSGSYTGYRLVNLQNLAVLADHDIPATVTCSGGARFEFGPLGNLKEGSDTQVQVSAEGSGCTIAVTPATGRVQCL